MPVLLSLTGCVATTKNNVADHKTDLHAKQFYQTGNFEAAAREYLALAKSEPANKLKYQLVAIDAFIQSGQIDIAKEIIDHLPQKKLNNTQIILRNIYNAQILLRKNHPDIAYKQLRFDFHPETPKSVYVKFHKTRAMVLEAQSEYFSAAKEYLLLNFYLNDNREISANYKKLWQALSHLSVDELRNYQSDNGGIIVSWLELILIDQTLLHKKHELNIAISAWKQQYPVHPALDIIIPDIIKDSKKFIQQPTQIALLLPLDSIYHDASVAIREGFTAAWYASRRYKPSIKIYKTDPENIIKIYQQAIAEGANFIVGPLQKPVITKLLEADIPTITTLLLNQYDQKQNDAVNIPELSKPLTFIQFHISPEDEARQIAERMWFDGSTRIIIVTPGNKTGQRIHDAFTAHWQKLGGTILAHANIDKNTQELRNAVHNLFNIHQSQQRGKILRNQLRRNVKIALRRRQDIHAIFMAVSPVTARRLIPEFRRYQTQNIGLYSTSSIYNGNINTRADNDVNGVIFTDMPWILDAENEYSTLNRTIKRNQKTDYLTYRRLHAFGIDAYHLIPYISQLILQPDQRYQGKTGTIKIDNSGYVHRRLIWGEFINGKPELYDAIN